MTNFKKNTINVYTHEELTGIMNQALNLVTEFNQRPFHNFKITGYDFENSQTNFTLELKRGNTALKADINPLFHLISKFIQQNSDLREDNIWTDLDINRTISKIEFSLDWDLID